MKKFLIVDDQEGWRNFNSNAVMEIFGNDAVVDFANCAQDGYTKLLNNFAEPYDCILTDMQMEEDYAPKMAGEWLIEQIKSISPYFKSKVVIISASPKIKSVAENYNVDYIPKNLAITSLEVYKDTLLK